MRNGGKLPDTIIQPIFLADTSHRIKVMCKPIFSLNSGTKDPDKRKSVDVKQIKQYTSYYIRQNRNKPLANLVENTKVSMPNESNDIIPTIFVKIVTNH